MVNKFYYNRGGAETYAFNLSELLKTKGHEVIPFSMSDEQNFSTPHSKYFVKNIDFVDSLGKFGLTTGVRVAYRSIYSLEAKQKIERLINDTKPDIAHLHNIHYHLTPSIIRILKKCNIPIVWTLHDYTLICPNSSFLSKNKVCEKCRRRKYFIAPLTRCKKGSFTASLLACIDSYTHSLMKTYSFVDKFISPSRFLKDKMIEYGVHSKRIAHIPNFIIPDNKTEQVHSNGNYVVYFGRLSAEKGVDTLIKAVCELKGVHLTIAGSGPAEEELRRLSLSPNGSSIDFLGHLQKDEIRALLNKALFVVLPSRCYENFPFTVLEAFASSKPVIGARIGGIAEQIDEGVDGFLFEPGNKEDLKDKIKQLLSSPELIKRMGEKAREKALKSYSSENHYLKIMEIYRQVKAKKSG